MVGNEIPVRDDDPLEAQFLLQKICDDGLVEREGYGRILCADRPRVVRHDLTRASCDGGFEWNQVVVEVVAWVGLVLAPGYTID